MEETQKVERLLFIFDANSGKFGAFVDSTKKLLMLKGCALCTITHGILGEKTEWKECKEELGLPIDYLHRDEVNGRLKSLTDGKLPCIVAQLGDENYNFLIGPDVLERCQGSVPDLRGKIIYYAATKNLDLGV
ncbi:MAG: hypothetical protein HZA19_04205 [Nitrospirae bacterium]|nr:hypothetical protein [Nitrospirota bacterium]